MEYTREPIKKITDLRTGEFYVDHSLVIMIPPVFIFVGIIKGKLCFVDAARAARRVQDGVTYTVKQVEDIISKSKLIPLTKVEKAKFLLKVGQR